MDMAGTARAPLLRVSLVLIPLLVSTACIDPPPKPELVAFVKLGGLSGDDTEPTELVPGRGHDDFAEELRNRGADNPEEWRPALHYRPSEDEHAFAFVLTGCDETSAELIITEKAITAELRGARADCAEPRMFLTVFSVAAETVPDTAELEP